VKREELTPGSVLHITTGGVPSISMAIFIVSVELLELGTAKCTYISKHGTFVDKDFSRELINCFEKMA
jgi:hypothetical protein